MANENKMLLLTEEEHEYLFNLVLDYGAYKTPRDMRNQVVQKLSVPYRIRDVEFELQTSKERAPSSILSAVKPA